MTENGSIKNMILFLSIKKASTFLFWENLLVISPKTMAR